MISLLSYKFWLLALVSGIELILKLFVTAGILISISSMVLLLYMVCYVAPSQQDSSVRKK